MGASILATLYAVRWRASSRSRSSNRRAQRSEAQAEKLLRRSGYRVEARQVQGAWTLSVDGTPVHVKCRADLLVRRRRRRYVAEVKSGVDGCNPAHPHTRRQLLEYGRAFDVDGLLLVDMVRGRISEIRFPDP
ncbi:MAG: hypothetical protein AB8H79_20880 [Myxococcota bacterium]